MRLKEKFRVVKRPAHYTNYLAKKASYSNNLYNSKSFFIRYYAYLPFISSIKELDVSNNNRVLDLGCADGPLLPTLSYNFNRSIALDINEELIKESKELLNSKLKNAGAIHLLCSDGQLLPFRDKSLDVVFCFELLEHVKDYRKIINEVFRVLSDGGILICTLPIELGPSLLIRTLIGKILRYKRPEYTFRQLIRSVFLKNLDERPKYIGFREQIGELGHLNFDWRIIFREIKLKFNILTHKFIPINFLRSFNPFIFIKATKKIK